jgi:phosphate transport system substrate-binding protein
MGPSHANQGHAIARRACLTAPILLAWPARADRTTVRVGGTGAALGLLQHLGTRHHASGGAAVEVLPSLGSVGARNALAEGRIDIAVTIEPEAPRAGISLGLTPLCAVCHATRRSTDLTLDELAALLMAERRRWPDGSPVRLVLRPSHDRELLPLATGPAPLRRVAQGPADRAGLPVAMTSQENASLLTTLTGSIGLMPLAQIITERLDLGLIAIGGVRPGVDSLAAGRWPWAIRFVVTGQARPRPSAQAFLDILAAPATKAELGVLGVMPERQGLPGR